MFKWPLLAFLYCSLYEEDAAVGPNHHDVIRVFPCELSHAVSIVQLVQGVPGTDD